MDRCGDLLDEAVRLDSEAGTHGKIVLIEDCIEVSGEFLLNYFAKRSLSTSGILIFVAFSQPLPHYDRILRKMGCNLSMLKGKNRLFFLDMYMHEFRGRLDSDDGLAGLYGRIHEAVVTARGSCDPVTILVDDVSLMEVAAGGRSNDVIDFMHYCRALALDSGCLLVMLCHGDIYVGMGAPVLLMWARGRSDVVLKVGQLATGPSNDVHGQVGIWRRKGRWDCEDEVHNLHFKVKETCVSYFYPGTTV